MTHEFAITDAEFGRFRTMVQEETGIQLPDSKRALLVGRLSRRLRELKLPTFGAYYEHVANERNGVERLHMIDLISTNETSFFREPKQFEFLEKRLLPAWAGTATPGAKKVRVWSAACSTGEEPYSIAMSLLSRLPEWEIEILATDISNRALAKARAAVFPIEKSAQIPEAHLKAFMLRGYGEQQGSMKAGPELRHLIRFERLNLHDRRDIAGGQFHLIFCRNVLIYFSAEGRAAVIRKLASRLAPGGYLFLGHAETLNGVTDQFRLAGPGVYARANESAASASAGTNVSSPLNP